MALRFNGAEIPASGDVRFLGASFSEVRFNGVTFWKRGGDYVEPPPTPGFCDASDGTYENMIRVQYGYSNYNADYNIYRSEDDISYSVIGTVTNGDLWFDDVSVVNDVTYYYKVTACWKDDDTVCSGFSESDTGIPKPDDTTEPPQDAPVNLVASDAVYYSKIVLGWENGSETDATHVNIYRDDYLIDSVMFGITEYQDFGVELGTTYTYYIAFKNGSGEGPASNTAEGRTLDDNIYVLKAGDTMTGHLTLSGDGVDDLHPATVSQLNALDPIPAGLICMWSGSTVPKGWVLCDGNNGTPDLMGRFIVGDYPGTVKIGGSADATLVEHTHVLSGSISDGGAHTHTVDLHDAITSGEQPYVSAGGSGDPMFANVEEIKVGGSHSHSHTLSVMSSGEDGAWKNLPPYYSLAYIMKT